jgi:hypothetical protein
VKAFWFVILAALALAGVVCGRRIMRERQEAEFRRQLEELPASSI